MLASCGLFVGAMAQGISAAAGTVARRTAGNDAQDSSAHMRCPCAAEQFRPRARSPVRVARPAHEMCSSLLPLTVHTMRRRPACATLCRSRFVQQHTDAAFLSAYNSLHEELRQSANPC